MREILAFVLLCFALLSFLFFFFECFDKVVSGLLILHLSLCPSYIVQFYVQWPGRLICADYVDCFSKGWLVRGIGKLPEERRRVTVPSFSSFHPQPLPALLPVWLRLRCQVFPFTQKDGSGPLLLYHPLLAPCPCPLLTKCSLITHSSIKPGQSALSCWVPD